MVRLDGHAISLLHKQLKSAYDVGPNTNFLRVRSAYCKGRIDNRARNVDHALSFPYIQINSRFNWCWMVFDIDYEFDYVRDIIDHNLPIPNYIVLNPRNGHTHLMYGLVHPVYTHGEFKCSRPYRYAKAVYSRLADLLGADRHFGQTLVKNPLHTDHVTYVGRDEFYSLGELASHIDINWVEDYDLYHAHLTNSAMPVADYEGVARGDRNQALFDYMRRIAYVKRYQGDLSESEFDEWVINRVVELDLRNDEPLQNECNGMRELTATARSIARWTWHHLKPGKGNGRPAYTDRQRALSLKTRRRNAAEKIKAVKNYLRQHKGASNRSIARALGYSLGSVNKYILFIKAQAEDRARKAKEVADKAVQSAVNAVSEHCVNQVVPGYCAPVARRRWGECVMGFMGGGPPVDG